MAELSGPIEPGQRSSGVLLHPTSLPGGSIGDLGAAVRFLDWLAAGGQRYWQILPLVPVDAGGSPYNGLSAFAGNPALVSPDFLVRLGLLEAGDVTEPPSAGLLSRVDFETAIAAKTDLLARAFQRFAVSTEPGLLHSFNEFRRENRGWLRDYVLFRALRACYGDEPWTRWPEDIRSRRPEAIQEWEHVLLPELDFYAFGQFIFDLEWQSVRAHARQLGISIIGDLPIFVAHDSADVWANPEIFRLDGKGDPMVVSGVPPDYFSSTGQRWGNPLYHWEVMKERSYDWWVERFRRTFRLVDVVRVDHFRGFESYWEIPAGEETAVEGRWEKGPGEELFREVGRQLGRCEIIVEDLGLITDAVEELRDRLNLPGMRVLQFAFDGDPRNPHLPENYPTLSVAYTGTHDNDTLCGWWGGLSSDERSRVREWLGRDVSSQWDLIEAVFLSAASLAIVPLQDLLGLGSEARMNTPGVGSANWTWRLPDSLDPALADRLRELTRRTGRG